MLAIMCEFNSPKNMHKKKYDRVKQKQNKMKTTASKEENEFKDDFSKHSYLF